MHQVLEHVKDPLAFVSKVHGLLNPHGVFFIATPNIWSLSNRLKYFYERAGLRRSDIGKYFDTSHHLNYFTPKTMKRLLVREDFAIKAIRNGHKVRPGQSGVTRFFMRHITERFIPRSTFYLIAQK
jgi:2-polyprenyl-3-methyl-5-hydroxy-6-metoxy-1,4-benzoquinol methylase